MALLPLSVSDKIKTLESVFCNQNIKELGVNQAAISAMRS
ncbi:hypothetical protein HPHPP25_1759 [Helicobacter pylori Hp P-25]|nr:hypothetical protein HPHPP25_1759 [Helicobacter pylori Hp P-25]EJC33361.1 hypothetical protein HPHPP25C_1482 [Helicobacter pylori Hp P-25c]EJC38871.1 hypothetical protein HPHPP25D_0551 [Helicobacter pylori Hp P-25d]